MTSLSSLKSKLMKDKAFRQHYEQISPRYKIAEMLINARVSADLTQEQVAEKMDVDLSVVGYMESGQTVLSLDMLQQYATAIGCELTLSTPSFPETSSSS